MQSNEALRAVAHDPALTARVANATGELLGEAYGELVHGILLSVQRGQMSLYMARILFERTLPRERPIPVQMPLIDVAADLVEADRRLMAAANVGAISYAEWRQGQECILASWEIRKQARLEEP
jgi:hypothetical protein